MSDDWRALVAHPQIDIIAEATGNPMAAVEHALAAFQHGKHVVMVTVEADAYCGPLLARRGQEAGVVYSLAYGDQPALICDLVDWARAAGFTVVAAGRGHKWLPHYAQSTPETVWGYGLTPEQAQVGGLNPKMFNSFLDGSKPAIESTAVCNATGLTPAPYGLAYPPASIDDLPAVMRPRAEGGQLHHKGQVEVVSSLERDGQPLPYDIRFGVWVRGRHGVHPPLLHRVRRPYRSLRAVRLSVQALAPDRPGGGHLGGLHRGAASRQAAQRASEPMRSLLQARPQAWRDPGRRRRLHGRRSAAASCRLLEAGALPLGLAHGWKVTRPVAAGELVRWADVVVEEADSAVRVRRDGADLCRAAGHVGPDGARYVLISLSGARVAGWPVQHRPPWLSSWPTRCPGTPGCHTHSLCPRSRSRVP